VAPTPPFVSGCDEVGSGEQWTVPSRWFVSSEPYTQETKPAGFVPAGNTPLEDFNAKFEGVKYVIDPGTKHEKTVSIPNSDALFVDTNSVPPGFILISPITLGAAHPLAVGAHDVELYWVLSDLHCDGLGTVVADNCLPAGDTLFNQAAFEVTAGHN
jgi:hypothetical protein